MSKQRIGILGIGSPFGGDSIAWHVIDCLIQSLDTDAIYLEKLDRPYLQLVPYLESFNKLIIIDALVDANKEGKIHYLTIDDKLAEKGLLSSHNCGVYTALALAKALGHSLEGLSLIGIEINQELPKHSPKLLKCAEQLACTLLDPNQEFLGTMR